jgi:hypothetical protein
MFMLLTRKLSLAVPLLLGAALTAHAQVTTGSLSGSVIDPAGAMIPGAKVDIKNENTGVVFNLTSNDAGLFKASFVPPGIYTVRVESQGFRVTERKNVEVLLSRETTVEVRLEVGQVSETVAVEGTAPLIETSSAQLSFNVENKKVVSLPGVQGALDRLALLSPGVVVGFGNINSNGLVFSANGQRARSNNFLLDGQDNNDSTIGGPGYFFSNLEAVGEFQVITNQFSAEYGRNAGAIVNTVVKSGSNHFHGNGTYFRRDDMNWTALTNFQRRSGLKTPPKFLDTILGGQIDGPILKDKLFFNAWTQRQWQRRDARFESTGTSLTPTPDGMRALQAAFPNSVPVRNLVQYGPFTIPLGNPTLLATGRATTQLRTPAGNLVDIEMGRLSRAVSQPSDNWDAGTKVDFRLSQKDLITGKYYHQDNTFKNAASNGAGGWFYDNPGRSKQVGGSWIRTFSPTFVNEARFSFIKTGFFFEGGTSFPFSEVQKNIANVTIGGGFLGYGLATNLPQYRLVNRYQFQDNVNKQMGRHSLKFGAQIQRDNIPLGFLPFVNGNFNYASFQTYVDNVVNTFNGASGEPTQEPKQTDLAFYFQDDWKVSNTLTLNLGVRYENSGQPINLLNDITVARESDSAKAVWNTALPLEARTYPRLKTDNNNFAPRIGFAWAPSDKSGRMGGLLKDSVIRGGYSVSYDPAFYNLMLNAQTAAPVVFAYTLSGSTVIPMPADITGANLGRIAAPPKGVDPRTFNQTLFDPNLHSPYSQNWSLGLQRRFGNNIGTEVRYVGTRAVGQFMTRNGNPLISQFLNNGFASVVPSGLTPTTHASCANCVGRVVPNYGVIRIRDNNAHSSYHGFQTRFDARNLLRQFTVGTSYTFSKTMDNVSEVFGFLGSGSVVIGQNPFNLGSGERGLSNNHIPHALSLNLNWEMPWGKAQKSWHSKLWGGWRLGIIDIWQAGRPMQPVQAVIANNALADTAFNSFVAGNDAARPFAANPSAPLTSVGIILPSGQMVDYSNRTRAVGYNDVRWIYNDLNSARALGTPFGVGRGILTGPRLQRADISMYKDFKLNMGERALTFQFRAEATNAFNHPAYGVPNLFIDSGTTTTFLNPTETEVAPRVFRLGMRINF